MRGRDEKCGKHTGQALGVRGGILQNMSKPEGGKSGKNIKSASRRVEWETKHLCSVRPFFIATKKQA